MSENFSSGPICRWCVATHDETCAKGKCFSGSGGYYPEETTRAWYDQQVQNAEAKEPSHGIKRRCAFNKCISFHCIDQQPPCLGHDLFEGVVAYDLQLYLQHIVTREKLIDVEELNQRIKAAHLSRRDARNRPKSFKVRKNNSKFEGNAGSIRETCLSTSCYTFYLIVKYCEIQTRPS